jgi:hypothetical protein
MHCPAAQHTLLCFAGLLSGVPHQSRVLYAAAAQLPPVAAAAAVTGHHLLPLMWLPEAADPVQAALAVLTQQLHLTLPTPAQPLVPLLLQRAQRRV